MRLISNVSFGPFPPSFSLSPCLQQGCDITLRVQNNGQTILATMAQYLRVFAWWIMVISSLFNRIQRSADESVTRYPNVWLLNLLMY